MEKVKDPKKIYLVLYQNFADLSMHIFHLSATKQINIPKGYLTKE